MGREDVGVSEVRGDSLESILLSGLSLGTLLNRVLFTLPMTARSLYLEKSTFQIQASSLSARGSGVTLQAR